MDEQELELDYEDWDDDEQTEANPEAFYWALKAALERPVVEVSPQPF